MTDRAQNTKYRQQSSELRAQKQFPRLFFSAVCVLCSVSCVLLCVSLASAQDAHKRFVYYIYWSGIRAGTAVLDVQTAGSGITIKTHATSAPWLSLFYEVDDFAQSDMHPDGYPRSFILKTREGRRKRDLAIYFEPLTGNSPQKIAFHNILDNEKKELHLETPAYDYLSALYALTKRPLQPGSSEYIDIIDHKRVWHTEVQVLKKENIRVRNREFNTILVKPLLQSEGLFRRTGDIFIWTTDDDKRLPVLLKSKVKIGHFTAELAEGDI
ncbi:MAG: DUF3108 domain-containing protein [Nitrospirae bacterium]|nr:DUF3108 domain-containing protein [Nitrospirota bacterium]